MEWRQDAIELGAGFAVWVVCFEKMILLMAWDGIDGWKIDTETAPKTSWYFFF